MRIGTNRHFSKACMVVYTSLPVHLRTEVVAWLILKT